MKYILIQVFKPAGLRSQSSTFVMSGKFDTLEEAQSTRDQKDNPDHFIIIQGW